MQWQGWPSAAAASMKMVPLLHRLAGPAPLPCRAAPGPKTWAGKGLAVNGDEAGATSVVFFQIDRSFIDC